MNLFRREEDLVSEFIGKSDDFLCSLLNKDVSKYFVVSEFDSHFGIADIVLGTYKPNLKNSNRDPVNPNWIAPLASFRIGACFDVEEFCRSYGFSKSGALKRLNEYARAGFLDRKEKNSFCVVKEYSPVTDLVVSVEAKLRDWRKALMQAQRYSRFSDYVFVLMDGAKIRPALEHLWIFEELNIGLISLADHEMELHFIPQKNKRKLSEYYLRLNEIAYGHLKSLKSTC